MRRSDRWRLFIETLRIRTRDRRIVPLKFNTPQERVWEQIAPKLDANDPIRLIILKARREGISTLIEALLMAFIAGNANVNALITAHMKKPAHKIWSMSKLFVTSSTMLKPLAGIGNSTISFGSSALEVATAGSPESERGGDLTAAHFSEGAFYPHKGFLTAAMQALPHKKEIFSIGIIESTANGFEDEGEDFYNEWERAEEGDSDWVPIFLPWHSFAEYSLSHVTNLEDMDEEEKELLLRFELTLGQLAWRRWSIKNNCKGQVEIFHQEYPSTAEEAFIQSGLPFFQSHELTWLDRFKAEGQRVVVDTDGAVSRSTEGYLEIWKYPEPGHSYIVGADSSMGMPDREDRKQHSRSAACVLDMDTLEQVAEYDAATAPHIFARHLVGIGRLYNNALLAPEVQSSGGGGGREVLVYIRSMDYYNLHRWTGDPDKIQRHPAILYGWECLDPESRVLTADLRWIPARLVKVGDRIIGCKETSPGGKGSSNALRIQTVTDSNIFVAPMVEVVLENGQTTRVSENHPFWRRKPKATDWKWKRANELRAGDFVKHLPTWEPLRSYEAGRLSAFLDGEGHLCHNVGHCGFNMMVTQVQGPLADEIRGLWSDLGFTATLKYSRRRSNRHHKDMTTSGVVRFADVLRALGSLRPTRLLRRFAEDDLTRFTVRSISNVRVASVTPIGDGPVVGLTTDPDHTLIADGIVGHNTNSKTRPRMLARIREVVMEKSVVLHSKRLIKQLSTFGESDSGHMEALAGRDDLLFAFGIALMSRSENYFKMPAVTSNAHLADAYDFNSLGVHFKTEETVQQRLRRIMEMRDPDERTFMEM